MAKKTNNFKKFGKLASIVKKIADKNPDFKEQILEESESTSKNSWNKIQKWTSKNLFPTFKQLPLKDFTLKKVENAISDDVATKKKSKCHNVFAIPDADLGIIDPFTLEETLNSFPPNLQVQIGIEGGNGLINTGIKKIKDFPNLGGGDITRGIRDMYPNIANLTFFRLRKIGKKSNDKANCSYYIKVVTAGVKDKDEKRSEPIDFFLSEDEKGRRVVKGVNVKDLTENQQKTRKQLKALIEKENRAKKTKASKREFKTPDKVVGKKEDKKVGKKEDKKVEEKGGERAKEIRGLINDLRKDVKDGFITKKFFQQQVAILSKKLEKGGLI